MKPKRNKGHGSGTLIASLILFFNYTNYKLVPIITWCIFSRISWVLGYIMTEWTWVLCRYEYRWADGVQIKKPIEVSAPKYVEYLMDWIEGQLDDESIFPQKLGMLLILVDLWCTLILLLTHDVGAIKNAIWSGVRFPFCQGTPFPPNFKEVVKTIFKRLFRVYAHIYHSHFQKIVSLKEEAHLNTCFKHFILFTNVGLLVTHGCAVGSRVACLLSWPSRKESGIKTDMPSFLM